MRAVIGYTDLDLGTGGTEQLTSSGHDENVNRGRLMGFLDKAKAKAEELAKQAKPAMQQAKEKAGPMAAQAREKAKPMAEKMKDSAEQAAKKAKAKADEMRENRKTDDSPPPTA
jgi:hypothetical protein